MISTMREPFEFPIGSGEIQLPLEVGYVWVEVEGDRVTSAMRLSAIAETGYVWEEIPLPPGGMTISEFQGST